MKLYGKTVEDITQLVNISVISKDCVCVCVPPVPPFRVSTEIPSGGFPTIVSTHIRNARSRAPIEIEFTAYLNFPLFYIEIKLIS